MTNLAIKENVAGKTEPESALGDALKAIKQQPLDTEIATVFVEMRESSGQSLEALSKQLGTNIDLLQDLEKGDLSHLPSWEVCSPIISNYTKMLGIDSKPILRRIALNIQARQKAENLKLEQRATAASMEASLSKSDEANSNDVAATPQKGENQSADGAADETSILERTQTAAVTDVPHRKDVKTLDEVALPLNHPNNAADSSADEGARLAAATIIPAAGPSEVKYRPVQEAVDKVSLDKNVGTIKPVSLEPIPLKADPEMPISKPEVVPEVVPVVKVLTPTKATIPHNQGISVPQELKVPLDEPRVQQVKSQLQRYDQPLFDSGHAKEPQLFGEVKIKEPKAGVDTTLRADKRDFSQENDALLAPPINDLLQPEKKGFSVFGKVMLVLFLLAVSYIAWFLYSEPKLGEMLLKQLPFLSNASV